MLLTLKDDQLHLYSGLAIRLAQALNLHQEVQLDHLSRTEQEMRRRVICTSQPINGIIQTMKRFANRINQLSSYDLERRRTCYNPTEQPPCSRPGQVTVILVSESNIPTLRQVPYQHPPHQCKTRKA